MLFSGSLYIHTRAWGRERQQRIRCCKECERELSRLIFITCCCQGGVPLLMIAHKRCLLHNVGFDLAAIYAAQLQQLQQASIEIVLYRERKETRENFVPKAVQLEHVAHPKQRLLGV